MATDPPTEPPTDPSAVPPNPPDPPPGPARHPKPTINLHFEPPPEDSPATPHPTPHYAPRGSLPDQPPPPTPGEPSAAMTLEQITAIKIADIRGKKIRRLSGVAFGDGVITAFFAFTCFLCGFSDFICFPLGIGLTYVAYTSLRNAAALKKFDVNAPKRLAVNQLVLAGLIVLYALYELWVSSHGGGIMAALDDPQVAGLLSTGNSEEIHQLAHTVVLVLYLGVIIGTVFMQGITAAYYYSRIHLLEEFLAVTPKWVIDFRRNIPR